MLLYDMTYLSTPKWTASRQTIDGMIPAILTINNEATVQIAQNGKLTHKTRHIERHFDYVRESQHSGMHQLHWIPGDFQVSDPLTASQSPSKIDPQLPRIFSILPTHMTRIPS